MLGAVVDRIVGAVMRGQCSHPGGTPLTRIDDGSGEPRIGAHCRLCGWTSPGVPMAPELRHIYFDADAERFRLAK